MIAKNASLKFANDAWQLFKIWCRKSWTFKLCIFVLIGTLLATTPDKTDKNSISKREEKSALQKEISRKILAKHKPELPKSKPDKRSLMKGTPDVAKTIAQLFQQKMQGKFVEVGTTGHQLTSFHLEWEYGWDGLLIEPNPDIYLPMLMNRKQKASQLNACIGHSKRQYKTPLKMQKRELDNIDDFKVHKKIYGSYSNSKRSLFEYAIKCYPLFDILKAADLTDIDLMAIDTRVPILQMLKSLPWNKAIVVEDDRHTYRGAKAGAGAAFQKKLREMMNSTGYQLIPQKLPKKISPSHHIYSKLD